MFSPKKHNTDILNRDRSGADCAQCHGQEELEAVLKAQLPSGAVPHGTSTIHSWVQFDG